MMGPAKHQGQLGWSFDDSLLLLLLMYNSRQKVHFNTEMNRNLLLPFFHQSLSLFLLRFLFVLVCLWILWLQLYVVSLSQFHCSSPFLSLSLSYYFSFFLSFCTSLIFLLYRRFSFFLSPSFSPYSTFLLFLFPFGTKEFNRLWTYFLSLRLCLLLYLTLSPLFPLHVFFSLSYYSSLMVMFSFYPFSLSYLSIYSLFSFKLISLFCWTIISSPFSLSNTLFQSF